MGEFNGYLSEDYRNFYRRDWKSIQNMVDFNDDDLLFLYALDIIFTKFNKSKMQLEFYDVINPINAYVLNKDENGKYGIICIDSFADKTDLVLYGVYDSCQDACYGMLDAIGYNNEFDNEERSLMVDCFKRIVNSNISDYELKLFKYFRIYNGKNKYRELVRNYQDFDTIVKERIKEI